MRTVKRTFKSLPKKLITRPMTRRPSRFVPSGVGIKHIASKASKAANHFTIATTTKTVSFVLWRSSRCNRTSWNANFGESTQRTATPVSQELPDRSPVIDAYLAEHQKLQGQSQQGIDYESAMRHGQLTLASLANLLSKHLGLSGNGLTEFEASEQIALETLYRERFSHRLKWTWQIGALKAIHGRTVSSTLYAHLST